MPSTAERPRWRRVVAGLIDLALLAGILVMSRLVLGPAMQRANVKADIRAVGHEATRLFEAFERYYESNLSYPATYTEPRFELNTLDPLRRRGYYRGGITTKLLDERIDAYDSPDDRALNAEFWVEMTLASDPSVRFLIAHSDDAPLGGGQWREGVFVFRDGTLEPL